MNAVLQAVALPLPRTEPIPAETLAAQLGWCGSGFMVPVLDGRAVYVCVRSRTRVDVGLWLRGAPIWAFALDHSLILAAWGMRTLGPRPWVSELRYTEVATATYNHVTGELLVDCPVGDVTPGLAMPPAAAYQLLAHLHRG
ncbi:MAG: hypothetical protein ACOCZK_02450 [Planctomycetota bacterium]